MIYRRIDFFQKHKCTGSPTEGINEFHEISLENFEDVNELDERDVDDGSIVPSFIHFDTFYFFIFFP